LQSARGNFRVLAVAAASTTEHKPVPKTSRVILKGAQPSGVRAFCYKGDIATLTTKQASGGRSTAVMSSCSLSIAFSSLVVVSAFFNEATAAGCGEVLLAGLQGSHANFMGEYSLEFNTYDDHPVFKVKATQCTRVLAPGSTTDFMLECSRNLKRPAFMYFNRKKKLWAVGMDHVGSTKIHLLAPGSASTPDLIQGSWYEADGKGGWKKSPNVTVTCKEAADRSPYHLPTESKSHQLDSVSDSKCTGWKATGGCNPDGPRETENDKPCHALIKTDWEGYCECNLGRKEKYPCGHVPMTCTQACAVHFPMVIAESAESWSSNQVSRNLVSPKGMWLAPPTTKQWVIFDIGAVNQKKPLQAIEMVRTLNALSCFESNRGFYRCWMDRKQTLGQGNGNIQQQLLVGILFWLSLLH
jgi:hypothetical protein